MSRFSFTDGATVAKIYDGDKRTMLRVSPRKKDTRQEVAGLLGPPRINRSFVERLLDLDEYSLGRIAKKNPEVLKQILDYCENDNNDYNTDNLNIRIPHATFSLTIDPRLDRQVFLIWGASGVGKTSIVRQLMLEYALEFPANNIFLFSLKKEDEAFDDLKNIIRIPYDEEVLSKIDIDTLENSLVVFDDTDCEKPTPEDIIIKSLQDAIVQLARSKRIYCIITSHMPCNFKKTRIILSETNVIVSFPKRCGYKHFEYLHFNYCGIPKSEIKSMWDLDTRWVAYFRNHPACVVYDSGAYIPT